MRTRSSQVGTETAAARACRELAAVTGENPLIARMLGLRTSKKLPVAVSLDWEPRQA